MTNKTLIFKKIPTGLPVPGEHLAVEDRPWDPEAPPPSGGLTLQILYSSLDPYQRGRMRDPAIKSYSPAYAIGAPIPNDCVARVLKSDAPAFKPGDLVLGSRQPIAQFAAVEDPASVRPLHNSHGLDLALFLGPLGMPGLTAYSGLHAIGRPKSGETIFVSSAAGAVGQVVGQIAKREGLRVIGSVGSDQKLEFVTKELGFDAAFNYKSEKPAEALARLAPDGIDIYFENVGGDHLEAALVAMKTGGRIPVCGMISDYNTPIDKRPAVRGLHYLISKQITMQGFLVFAQGFGPKYFEEHQRNVQQWLADGSVKARLHVTEGIANAGQALVGMLKGDNFGKAVLKIADP